VTRGAEMLRRSSARERSDTLMDSLDIELYNLIDKHEQGRMTMTFLTLQSVPIAKISYPIQPTSLIASLVLHPLSKNHTFSTQTLFPNTGYLINKKLPFQHYPPPSQRSSDAVEHMGRLLIYSFCSKPPGPTPTSDALLPFQITHIMT
jgi:hypothetical protein